MPVKLTELKPSYPQAGFPLDDVNWNCSTFLSRVFGPLIPISSRSLDDPSWPLQILVGRDRRFTTLVHLQAPGRLPSTTSLCVSPRTNCCGSSSLARVDRLLLLRWVRRRRWEFTTLVRPQDPG